MKATYYNDSLRSYMIIPCPPEAQTRGYQYRMLGMNRIEGLLSCSLRHIDGTGYLYYDITGRQSMAGLYEGRKISGAEFYNLLESVVKVSGSLSEYLLDEQYLVMSEEQIFYDLGTGKYCFAYYPGEVIKPEIFRFLADNIDSADKLAVAAAYRLCAMAEGGRQALKEAVNQEAEQKDMPDLWERWKKERQSAAEQDPPAEIQKDNAGPRHVASEKNGPVSGSGGVRAAGTKSKKKETGGGEQNPLRGAAQLIIRIGLILLLLAGAGGLTAVQMFVYISRREKRLCIAGAVLLVMSAVLIAAEMIMRTVRTRRKKKEDENRLPEYSRSDEKDMPVFGAASGEDYRIHDDEAGNTIRLSEQDVTGRLYGRDRGNRIDLRTLPLTVGKAQSFSDVVIPDPSISRVHARIYRGEEGGIEIKDLGSTNGTYINGVRIKPNEKARVQRGDEVRFGSADYEYR